MAISVDWPMIRSSLLTRLQDCYPIRPRQEILRYEPEKQWWTRVTCERSRESWNRVIGRKSKRNALLRRLKVFRKLVDNFVSQRIHRRRAAVLRDRIVRPDDGPSLTGH